MAVKYADLTLDVATKLVPGDRQADDLLFELKRRRAQVADQQQRFATWCDRADLLYYAEDVTQGGADLWANHPSATTPGYSHVSVNTPSIYVDIPAALQSVPPIENMLATDTTPEARQAAAALERIYYAWKREEDWDLKVHQACITKGLYGRAAVRVYWDDEEKRPCVELIDQPRNLYLGWKSDRYDELVWAAYVQRMSPDAIQAEYSVEVEPRDLDGVAYPYVRAVETEDSRASRTWLNFGPAMIEVWDYWFLKPKGKSGPRGYKTKMSVWNACFVGTELVRYAEHDEFDGKLPILPLFNTYLPGVPDGRSDLYDVEQLLREKMERITDAAQMIHMAAAGNYWQLTGQEAPNKVSPSVVPRLNEVIAPGPGNRIEVIQPFIAQFQLEQFLGRIDRELAEISGLSELLKGLSPLQALSSSKAVNALIANYETRLRIRRDLLYKWLGQVWGLVVKVLETKNADVRQFIRAGGGKLDIRPPSLNPRDELETATRVLNLVNGKLWSGARGMDAVGVDDPESEQDVIREERTDATLNPADVQVMVQLYAALKAVGAQVPQGAQQIAGAQAARAQSDLRNAYGGATPDNGLGSQLTGDQGVTPPEAGTPGEGGAPPAPFIQGPAPAGPEGAGLAQTLISGGKAKSRILTQTKLGRR